MCSQEYTLYTCGCKHEGEFKQDEERHGIRVMCYEDEHMEKLNKRPHWYGDCFIPESEVTDAQAEATTEERKPGGDQ
jgi:hypothetical protein